MDITVVNKVCTIKNAVDVMIKERNQSEINTPWIKNSVLWSTDTVEAGRHAFLEHFNEEELYKIRLYAGYVTGMGIGTPSPKDAITDTWKFYTGDIPTDFWVSEPTILGEESLGVLINGKLINYDYLRYQACITNLYLQGVFNDNIQHVIMEIGVGSGGLAYSFEQLPVQFTYILMDIPESLMLAAAYLAVNSHKRIYLYDPETFNAQFIKTEIYNYDFVLLPNYVLPLLYELEEITLLLNQASFQEMTNLQLDTYLDFAVSKVSGFIYSDNVDRHAGNKELTYSISESLNTRFKLLPSINEYNSLLIAATVVGKQYLGIPFGGNYNPGTSIRLYDRRIIVTPSSLSF